MKGLNRLALVACAGIALVSAQPNCTLCKVPQCMEYPTACKPPGSDQVSCNFQPKRSGVACDDGDPKTTPDSCDGSGKCVGIDPCNGAVCGNPPDSQCQLSGICRPSNDPIRSLVCDFPDKTNGTKCDDNDPLTFNDICMGGWCKGNPSCKSCRPPNTCEVSKCLTNGGICEYSMRADGTKCDDDDAFTSNDQCTKGVCKGTPSGTPTKCMGVACPVNDPCSPSNCDPSTGKCVAKQMPDGMMCDDGNSATTHDRCTKGVCKGLNRCKAGANSLCYISGDKTCQRLLPCDPETGKCSVRNVKDGTKCDDGNVETHDDRCKGGLCLGKTKCTTRNTKCKPVSQCHDVGLCDPATGLCHPIPKGNGAPCDDGNVKTMNDVCLQGTCTGIPVGNPATLCQNFTCPNSTEQCMMTMPCNGTNPNGPCSFGPKPDGTACNDHLTHTINDKCKAGKCVGEDKCDNVQCTSPKQCFDAGHCDPMTGKCVNQLPSPNGTACDDNNPNTFSDACWKGACAGRALCHEFCLNGGACSVGGVTAHPICNCNGTNFTGTRCQVPTKLCNTAICPVAPPRPKSVCDTKKLSQCILGAIRASKGCQSFVTCAKTQNCPDLERTYCSICPEAAKQCYKKPTAKTSDSCMDHWHNCMRGVGKESQYTNKCDYFNAWLKCSTNYGCPDMASYGCKLQGAKACNIQECTKYPAPEQEDVLSGDEFVNTLANPKDPRSQSEGAGHPAGRSRIAVVASLVVAAALVVFVATRSRRSRSTGDVAPLIEEDAEL